MSERDLRNLLDFAVESAQLAGSLTLAYFNTRTPHELKADRSPVTVADRGAEQLLRDRISQAFPEHGLLGEEYGEVIGSAPFRWILDPIDGTYSFISGVPLYSVLVGVERRASADAERGEMVVGVIHLPALGETVYAARGLGCWWNGRRARVSTVAELSAARLCTTSTSLLAEHAKLEGYTRLRDRCLSDRGWGDAYQYALVATGRAEIACDPIVSLWDTAALEPVVREAGGAFTDWHGRPGYAAPEALATNGVLHDEVVATLRGGRVGE